MASIPQVYVLADNMPERLRLLILAAAFTGVRWGELIALRRSDVDLSAPSVRVPRKLAQLDSGQLVPGPTKSAAGFRTVALPPILVPEYEHHVAAYVASSSDALLFTGEKGAMLRRGNWHRTVRWANSVRKAGLPDGFRFHDLRHTGNHFAAVVFPRRLVPVLRGHLSEFVASGSSALIFCDPKGAVIRRSNFRKQVGWTRAVHGIGVPGLHFHDLRHTGNHLAAQSKVSTRDLMNRMGTTRCVRR